MSEPEYTRGEEHPEDPAPEEDQVAKNVQWTAGLVGGLAGGVLMGLIMQFAMGVMELLGAIIGVESAIGGWIVHLAMSALLGLIFAYSVAFPFVRDFVDDLGGGVLVGLTYGALLEVVSGGIILTLVAEALNITEQAFPLVPTPGVAEGIWLAVAGTVAHLLYGGVLGAMYVLFRDDRIR
jgi:predicted lipid-binding transport protein (Tim44 family)